MLASSNIPDDSSMLYWKVQYLKTQILQSMVVLRTHSLSDLNELASVHH